LFPGSNFIGPNTKIATKILAGVQPNSATDKAAMYHDLNYLLSNGGHTGHFDEVAINGSDLTISGIALNAGLRSKMVLDSIVGTTFNKPSFKTAHEAKIAHELLVNKINSNQLNNNQSRKTAILHEITDNGASVVNQVNQKFLHDDL
jgi:hypothetical protein